MVRLGSRISLTRCLLHLLSTCMTTFLRRVVQMNPLRLLLSDDPAPGFSAVATPILGRIRDRAGRGARPSSP